MRFFPPIPGNDTGTCVADGGDSADMGMNCSWTRVSELCAGIKIDNKTKKNRLKKGYSSFFVLTYFYVYPVIENVATGGEGDAGNLYPQPPSLPSVSHQTLISITAEQSV